MYHFWKNIWRCEDLQCVIISSWQCHMWFCGNYVCIFPWAHVYMLCVTHIFSEKTFSPHSPPHHYYLCMHQPHVTCLQMLHGFSTLSEVPVLLHRFVTYVPLLPTHVLKCITSAVYHPSTHVPCPQMLPFPSYLMSPFPSTALSPMYSSNPCPLSSYITYLLHLALCPNPF